MRPEDWKVAFELFHECLELAPEARHRHLAESRGAAPEVVAEVEALLVSYERVKTSFLEVPAFGAPEAAAPPPTLDPGETIGDYKIDRVLGRGAFATVYLARQESLGRDVALKISAQAGGEEARIMARLEHPNIVRVHSSEAVAGRGLRLICMQYVPGPSLEHLIGRLASFRGRWTGADLLAALDAASHGGATFDPEGSRFRQRLEHADHEEAVLILAREVACSLSFAHGHGVLHLDVKPGNILVDPYARPMLVDFNVSVHLSARGVGPHRILGGTRRYMAPEQEAAFSDPSPSHAVDGRADVFALGRVMQDLAGEGAPLSEELAAVIDRCTRSAPEERFEDAEALARALESRMETRRLEMALPEEWFLVSFARRWPALAIYAVLFVPNFVASLFQILYNRVHIVGNLTPEQLALFDAIVPPWNVFIFTLVSGLIVFRFRELFAVLLGRRRVPLHDSAAFARLRRQLACVPPFCALAVGSAWGAALLLFLTALHVFEGPLDPDPAVKLVVSFLLSALVSIPLSLVALHLIRLRVLLPRFLRGVTDLDKTLAEELGGAPPARFAKHLTVAVPLFGAIIIVTQGPESYADHFLSFQVLVVIFIVIGMAGFMLTARMLDDIGKLFGWLAARSQAGRRGP